MEAQSAAGLPTVKTARLRGGILVSRHPEPDLLGSGFFGEIQREDRGDSDFLDGLPGVRLLPVILPAG
jgi:hypothetical protein